MTLPAALPRFWYFKRKNAAEPHTLDGRGRRAPAGDLPGD
jgi:hypothetical protein